MALPSYGIPFGLRDVKLWPLDATGETPGTIQDLPASRTLSFSDTEDFEELRGDDTLITSHGAGPTADWNLESGGISLECYKIMAGGAIVTTGVTPNIKKTYTKLGTDARPFFKAEGQSISDSGGDVHGILYKCKADGELGGEFSEGSFYLTAASGTGFARTSDAKIYEFVHNETAAAIV